MNFKLVTVRISVFVTLLFVTLEIVAFGYIERQVKNDVVSLISSQLLTVTNFAAQDIDKTVAQRREFLSGLAAKAKYQPDNSQDWRSWAQGIRDDNSFFPSGIFVLDPDGHVLAAGPATAHPYQQRINDSGLLLRALRSGVAISHLRINQETKTAEAEMAVPVLNDKGVVRAFLVGSTSFSHSIFLDRLLNTRIGVHGNLVLVSPQDKVLLERSGGTITLRGTPPEGLHHQLDMAVKGFRGVGLGTRPDGTKELAAIASIPSADWFLVAREPTSEVFAPVERLRRTIAGTAIVSCLALSILLFALLRYLLRHLRYVAAHADQMTQGQIPLESLPVAEDDEVGHLTSAFNRLLEKLLSSQENLDRLAHYDALTGMANRMLFNNCLEQFLARARRQGSQMALLYMDLDGFKPINDTYGHVAGDEVLRQFAQRLSAVTRKEDVLARIGGDEFILLIGDLHDAATEAPTVAAKCQNTVLPPVEYRNLQISFGISIGIACYPADGETSDELLAKADQCMYRNKRENKERKQDGNSSRI